MKGYPFSITLTVRAGEVNYGGHVGFQQFLTYFQEAHIAYFRQWGYSELDIEGAGIIVGEANCRYMRELLLQDTIEVGCRISELRSKRFTFQYRIERDRSVCAEGHTHIFCFDYTAKRVIPLPGNFVRVVRAFENLA